MTETIEILFDLHRSTAIGRDPAYPGLASVKMDNLAVSVPDHQLAIFNTPGYIGNGTKAAELSFITFKQVVTV